MGPDSFANVLPAEPEQEGGSTPHLTSVCSRPLRPTLGSASGPWPLILVELGTGRWPRGSTDPREEHLPGSLKVKQSYVSEGGKMSQKQLFSRKSLTRPDWSRPCPTLQSFTSVLASGRGHLLLQPGQRWGTQALANLPAGGGFHPASLALTQTPSPSLLLHLWQLPS